MSENKNKKQTLQFNHRIFISIILLSKHLTLEMGHELWNFRSHSQRNVVSLPQHKL